MRRYVDVDSLIKELHKITYFGEHNETELFPEEIDSICYVIDRFYEISLKNNDGDALVIEETEE